MLSASAGARRETMLDVLAGTRREKHFCRNVAVLDVDEINDSVLLLNKADEINCIAHDVDQLLHTVEFHRFRTS